MATTFRRQIGENRRQVFFLATRIPQRWQDDKAHGRIDTSGVLSTAHKNLANFRPLTSEFTTLIWQPF